MLSFSAYLNVLCLKLFIFLCGILWSLWGNVIDCLCFLSSFIVHGDPWSLSHPFQSQLSACQSCDHMSAIGQVMSEEPWRARAFLKGVVARLRHQVMGEPMLRSFSRQVRHPGFLMCTCSIEINSWWNIFENFMWDTSFLFLLLVSILWSV